jgi:hypothetical protein
MILKKDHNIRQCPKIVLTLGIQKMAHLSTFAGKMTHFLKKRLSFARLKIYLCKKDGGGLLTFVGKITPLSQEDYLSLSGG